MRLQRFLLLFITFLMALAAAACEAQPKVTIVTKTGEAVVFHVEVADNPAKRAMGLQYRRELGRDRGMIFLFPSEASQSFWMKNTPIALDMIFINRDRRIAGIVEQTVPFSLDSRSVGVPSQFVLEINGGLARQHGIQSGDEVRFEDFSIENVTE
jgi:uncharacterized protein